MLIRELLESRPPKLKHYRSPPTTATNQQVYLNHGLVNMPASRKKGDVVGDDYLDRKAIITLADINRMNRVRDHRRQSRATKIKDLHRQYVSVR